MRKYVVFHWLYWTLLNSRGQSWSTANTSIQLPSHPYPCEGERTERPEQPVSALSEFWWRLCFSTRPHGSITFFFLSLFCCPSPCSAVKESGEKKLEGSPKQWLFSQEDPHIVQPFLCFVSFRHSNKLYEWERETISFPCSYPRMLDIQWYWQSCMSPFPAQSDLSCPYLRDVLLKSGPRYSEKAS